MTEKEAFSGVFEQKRKEFEKHLTDKLPQKEGYAERVISAMEYSVLAGGKRLRPILMQAAYELFSDDGNAITDGYLTDFMCAIEMIHTYSLVHDDLPAMDNDDYRRGKLTTWKVYGDGMGVLSGDALLNYAFEILLETSSGAYAKTGDTAVLDRCIRAAGILAHKSGYRGMIGGQCADIEAEGKSDTKEDEILFIHEHKTACLIEAALMMGAVLGGASAEEVSILEKLGSLVGIAFQIRDDILDVIGESEKLGKSTGSDEANGKITYVTLNGLEKSEADVNEMTAEANKLLEKLPGDKAFLSGLIDMLAGRMN